MPATTGAFSNLIAPGLRKVFSTDLKLAPSQYESIFNVDSSSHAYEKEITIGGLDTMPTLAEGAGVTYEDPTEGYKTTYTHVKYGLGFSVTLEMWADDMYKQMVKATRYLARSANKAIQTSAANVFNRAFNTSYTGADGSFLCATSHALLGGSTAANRPTNDADLNLTTLESGITTFREIADDQGDPCGLAPAILLVPNELEFTALRLVRSAQLPDSANNDINPIQNRVKVVVWDWLTDADAWFLLADKSNHQLQWFWRMKQTFTNDDDFSTGNALFKCLMRYSNGWTDWRGVYGTSGA